MLVLAVAVGAKLWRDSQLGARVAEALPPPPDLSGWPAELQMKVEQARAAAGDRTQAFAGVAELARLYQANGFTDAADSCWRLVLAGQPEHAEAAYCLAELRRLAGDQEEMVRLLGRTTSRAPDYAAAWLRLGEVHLKTGNVVEAGRAFERRLALSPQDPYARLGLARLAWQQGDRSVARSQLERLVADTPDFPPGHNLYAEILATDGDEARAAEARRQGRDAGRFREAEDPWLDALLDRCFDYEQLCVRGAAAVLTRQFERGRGLLERAIALRPQALPAYESLGNLYLDLNDAARAREVYQAGLERAAEVAPAGYYASLSRVHAMLQQPAEAERVAREGLQRAGESPELLNALGVALGALGQDAAAVAALREAVARNPNDANAQYNLAVALLSTRELDDAITALERSLAAQPTFPPALSLLAQISIDSGRWQEAVRYLEPLYESNPQLPEAREKMAFGYLRAGEAAEAAKDVAAAEKYYRAGVAVDGAHADLQVRLGALLLQRGRFAEAVTPLEAAQQLHPSDPQIALILGRAYIGSGRRDDARRVVSAGLRLAEQAGNAALAERCREILSRLP